MAFHNVSLDADIAYGLEGGPGWRTIVQTTASGHEHRVTRQAQMRHRYRPVKELLTPEQFSELKDFKVARRGALHGFRWKDWADYTTSESGITNPSFLDVVLGTGDGSNKDFQLIKTYDTSGPNAYARVLTLPFAGTVLAAKDGVQSTAFTLTNPGGLITFDTAPANGVVVTAGCQFEVPVRFAESTDEWMRARYTDFERIAWEFELVEILNETEWPENWWPGGSSGLLSITSDITLSTNIRLWTISPASSLNAFLPPPDGIPGGDIFVIVIPSGAAGSLTIRDDAGASIVGPLSAPNSRHIGLRRSGSSAAWEVFG